MVIWERSNDLEIFFLRGGGDYQKKHEENMDKCTSDHQISEIMLKQHKKKPCNQAGLKMWMVNFCHQTAFAHTRGVPEIMSLAFILHTPSYIRSVAILLSFVLQNTFYLHICTFSRSIQF